MRTMTDQLARRLPAVVALLAASSLLCGCGVFFVARQGTKLYNELSNRNETLAKQRDTMRAQLWPELQAFCRKTPDVPPAAALPVTQVAFDEGTAALVSDDAMRSLPGVSAERAPLREGRPAADQAFVFLDRSSLRSEPALTLTAHTLRIEDRGGRLLGRATQFAFDWQAQTTTEYRSCAEVLAQAAPPGAEPPTRPDLTLLGRAFGTR